MTLDLQNDATLTEANQASEPSPRVDPWAALRSPVWRAFTFESGHFLLHVPSSHVLEVPETMVRHVRGEVVDQAAQAELDRLARELPLPPPRTAKTNIQAASLNMAQGCNLRCTYCFAGEGDYGVKGMMSFEIAVKALELLAKGKERFHVIFFGGEPMLNFSVIQQVVAWCEKQQNCRYTFGMTTNGTLLNEERLAWLKEKKFALVWSYDGKGLQAKQRLNKDKVSNSEALVERKINAFTEQLATLRDFKLRTTITRENLDLLEEAIVNTLTSRNFRTVVAHHATPLRALHFGPKDIAKLGAILTRVVDRFLASGEYEKLLQLQFIRGHVANIHAGRTRQMACGAGVNYLTVSAEGGFYLCHRFNEDESERFGDIEVGLKQERLDEIARFRAGLKDPCSSCWIREWCAGGCFHEHKMASGDKFDLDPMYCQLQSLEIEQAMRVYTVLLEKAPQLIEE